MSESPFYNGCAIVDRSDLKKLKLSGPQAAWFLDQLLTGPIERLRDGAWSEALLLTPKGRTTAYLQVARLEDLIFLTAVQSPASEPLADFLRTRVFTTRVEIEDVTDAFSILTLIGPRTQEVSNVLTEISPRPGELARSEHIKVWGVERPMAGLDIWLPSSEFENAVAALTDEGAVTVTSEQYAEVCAASGYPIFGKDFDETFLPQEAALERAVAFDKGCYLGQEAVAMAQRGKVKRRLRRFEFSKAPLAGRVHSSDGIEKGTVTSVGSGPDGSFGVGPLSTDVEIGSAVTVQSEDRSESAVVKELPGTSSGPQRPSARELREKLQPGS